MERDDDGRARGGSRGHPRDGQRPSASTTHADRGQLRGGRVPPRRRVLRLGVVRVVRPPARRAPHAASRGRVPLPRARRGRAGGVPRFPREPERARRRAPRVRGQGGARPRRRARLPRDSRAVRRPPRPRQTLPQRPLPRHLRRQPGATPRDPSIAPLRRAPVILRRRRRARPPGPPRRRVVRLARRPRRLPGRRPLRHHPFGPTRRRGADRRGGFRRRRVLRAVPRRRPRDDPTVRIHRLRARRGCRRGCRVSEECRVSE